jgi:hypothetical protein
VELVAHELLVLAGEVQLLDELEGVAVLAALDKPAG